MKKKRETRKKVLRRLPCDVRYTQSREMSWLQFDRRVLDEARDGDTPPGERLRFAAIFRSNLDEFFRVRIGALTGRTDETPDPNCGWPPAEHCARLLEACGPLYSRFDETFADLEAALADAGVRRIRPRALRGAQRRFVARWYETEAAPLLTPLVPDARAVFPQPENGRVYLAATLVDEAGTARLGLLPVPDGLPPVLVLPGEGLQYVLPAEVLCDYLAQSFPGFTLDHRFFLRVTRSADAVIADDPDAPAAVRRALRQRPHLAPVRLEYRGKARGRTLRQLCVALGLDKSQMFESESPLDLSYAQILTDLLDPSLRFPPHTPCLPAWYEPDAPVTPQIRTADRLLHFPYECMDPFLQLLRESAFDPAVTEIQITAYRLAAQSQVACALIEAARRGKAITVLIELRARFDEENNLEWADRLRAAGCRVLYGLPAYKVHAKLCRIGRVDGALVQIGTGNYHEQTARLYTDFSLLSADAALTEDVRRCFDALADGLPPEGLTRLITSPRTLRPALLAEIARESANGPQGRIVIKCNAVTDRQVIDALAAASRAGVQIDLIVRGVCCLVPGIAGHTETIRVRSVVGRFLEHHRVYAFGTGADARVYLASADLMERSLDKRVEAAVRLTDPACAARVRELLDLCLRDNVKARTLDDGGDPKKIDRCGAPRFSVQDALLEQSRGGQARTL